MEALVNKAGVLAALRDWPGVQMTCSVVFEKDPNSARCLLSMGYRDEEEGRLNEAREKFILAFRHNAELSQALLHQGIVEARMGNLGAAMKTLETAAQRSPTAPVLNNLGSVYANRGELQKAIQAFEKAVRTDPTFEPARLNLERALADSR
jgi:tetratricopeptide (TPR) repeat protein